MRPWTAEEPEAMQTSEAFIREFELNSGAPSQSDLHCVLSDTLLVKDHHVRAGITRSLTGARTPGCGIPPHATSFPAGLTEAGTGLVESCLVRKPVIRARDPRIRACLWSSQFSPNAARREKSATAVCDTRAFRPSCSL